MDQLSPLDAGFLDAEDEDRHASLAIASVAIAEGPPPSHDDFLEVVRARLPMIPRYRHRVRTVPFDLGRPIWADDPNFDLAYHIRRTALPAPGDDAALSRLVARVMSQRLDRDRPLWECWVVEGLAGGRWAVVLKVHHCMVDGVSGSHLLRLIFDDTRRPARRRRRAAGDQTWRPEGGPSTAGLVLRTLGSLLSTPAEQVRLLAHVLRAPRVVARELGGTVSGLVTLAGVLLPGSRSSLTGPIGQPRRYGFARAHMSDVLTVSKAFDVTVNDVVLTCVSGGLRALLMTRGEKPTRNAVRALVPVSVRAKGDEAILDNRISLMLPLLPVDVADPVDRLRAVHAHLKELKASNEAQAGAAVTSLAKYEPFAPISWAVRMVTRLPQRTIVTVATNVPGPRQPLYVLGRRIVEILPYVPIALRMRTGVAALSYCDQLTFGLTLDYDSAPEVDLLAKAMTDCLDELVAAARPPRTHSVRSGRPGGTARTAGANATSRHGQVPARLARSVSKTR